MQLRQHRHDQPNQRTESDVRDPDPKEPRVSEHLGADQQDEHECNRAERHDPVRASRSHGAYRNRLCESSTSTAR
jgi:hypothetical protein